MIKYQIWYRRSWPLTLPTPNLALAKRYANRLRTAYGDTDRSIIKIRKIHG